MREDLKKPLDNAAEEWYTRGRGGGMEKSVNRVDRDAQENEEERKRREREAIAEMAGVSDEDMKENGEKDSDK